MVVLYNPEPSFKPAVLPSQVPRTVVPSYARDKGVAADWLFYNGTGDKLLDFSGYGNHGDFVNDPTWTDEGIASWALDFDGADDFVDIGDPDSLNASNLGTFTMNAWAYPEVTDGTFDMVIRKELEYAIVNSETDNWEFWIFDSDAGAWRDIVGSAVTADEWTMVTGVWDGTNQELYLDGSLDASNTPSVTLNSTTNSLGIGATGSGGYPWNGMLGEVRIYSRALSESEVKNHYEETRALYGI